MRAAAAIAAAGAAAVLAGCGARGATVDEHGQAIQRGADAQRHRRLPGPPPYPAVPPGTPLRGTRPARAGDRDVVRRWAATLRRGDARGAARLFASPTRVQNGDRPFVLRTAAERYAFNATLPCGARPTSYAAARGFVIVAFRLVERPGGACGSGAGQAARCAIRVRHGRITDWIRLPDQAAPDAGVLAPDSPTV